MVEIEALKIQKQNIQINSISTLQNANSVQAKIRRFSQLKSTGYFCFFSNLNQLVAFTIMSDDFSETGPSIVHEHDCCAEERLRDCFIPLCAMCSCATFFVLFLQLTVIGWAWFVQFSTVENYQKDSCFIERVEELGNLCLLTKLFRRVAAK